jgi:hypothetical protein
VVESLEGRTLPSFVTTSATTVGAQPYYIAVADFDRDGTLDFAVVNYASNTVSVALGAGNGTFPHTFTYATGTNPRAVVVGDFNGDGKLDLAVANAASNTVSVLLGNGDGTFQKATSYATGKNPRSLAVADFTGDGKLDLVTGDYDTGSVSVLLGNGNGTFQSPLTYQAGDGPRSVAVADFNGDGRPDIAVGNEDGNSVSILLGNGNGTFRPAVNYAVGSGPWSMATADFNGDGLPDLVTANLRSNNVSVLLNAGHGTFRPAVNYAVGTGPYSVAVGDFNHDGHVGVATADFNSATVTVLEGTGTGTFLPACHYHAPDALAVAVGDFNGDGRLDLAVANKGPGQVSVLLNQATDRFVTGSGPGSMPEVHIYNASTGALVRSFLAYDPSFRGGVRVAMGDVTGDGVPDIITAPGPGGGPDIRVYDGKTGALVRAFLAYDISFLGGVYVAAGDVNGDGYADIITGAGSGGGPHVKVFSGRDGSVLQSFFAYAPNFFGGVTVAAGDVNGDGKADIITGVGAGGGPHVKVFSGTDGSVLQSFFAYASNFFGGVTVAAGAVTGDGRANIITGVGAGGGPQVKVFDARDGSVLRSFWAYDPSFFGGVTVAAADLLGDGWTDIITGAGAAPHVKVFDRTNLAVRDSFFAYDPSFNGGVFVGGSYC